MQSASKCRRIGILILLFFTAGSFVFPGRLVVCMRHGHEARVVPVHAAHLICTEQAAKQCDGVSGSQVEITHQHVPCNDVPLSNPGDIGDRGRLPGPGRTWTGSLTAGTTNVACMGIPERSRMAPFMPGFHSSVVSQHIQSVVLII